MRSMRSSGMFSRDAPPEVAEPTRTPSTNTMVWEVTAPRRKMEVLERLREELKARMANFTEFARLITRAELDGAEPEKFLDPDVPTPAQLLAEAIREQQQRPHPGTLDPAMVAAYINAATFAFATLAPWLMTAVGLEPSDYETRLDDIVDISMLLIAMSASE